VVKVVTVSHFAVSRVVLQSSLSFSFFESLSLGPIFNLFGADEPACSIILSFKYIAHISLIYPFLCVRYGCWSLEIYIEYDS